MGKPQPSLAGAGKALVLAARQALDVHPTPSQLIAYQEGRLLADRAAKLRDHLSICADCADIVLDWATFPRLVVPPTAAGGATAPPLDWEGMREHLRHDSATLQEPRLANRSPVPSRLPVVSTQVLRWALAACLAGLVGSGLWLRALHSNLRELSVPRVNIVYQDLVPIGEGAQREAGSEQAALVAPGSACFLALTISNRGSFADYELEIFGLSGNESRLVWTATGLAPSTYGTFTLELPPNFLAPGGYRLRLYGRQGDERQPLADYHLRVGQP